MKNILIAVALAFGAQHAAAEPTYTGTTLNTTTGKATMNLNGYLLVGRSSVTTGQTSTPTVTLDGTEGSVRALKLKSDYGVEAATGNFSGNVTAGSFTGTFNGSIALADSLTANGANCAAGTFPLGVDATGAAESCTSIPGVSSATVIANPAGYVPNGQLDPSSVTKQGFVTRANLTGANPASAVDLSTVTVALALKVDKNDPSQVNLSTVTTALALKVDLGNPAQINLSTVTAALALKVDKNDPSQVNLSTVTTQFNSVAVATTALSASTVSIVSILNTVGVSTTALSVSTAALRATDIVLAASTTTLSASTVTIVGILNSVGSSTNTLSLSTASIYSALQSTAGALTTETARALAAEALLQPLDADLTDLADGSLTGSKVGSGVPAANIANGTMGTVNTGGNAATATALAANGANCSSGQYPLGVDASGAAESCTAAGIGDAVLNSTQAFSGTNTFNSLQLMAGSTVAAGGGTLTFSTTSSISNTSAPNLMLYPDGRWRMHFAGANSPFATFDNYSTVHLTALNNQRAPFAITATSTTATGTNMSTLYWGGTLGSFTINNVVQGGSNTGGIFEARSGSGTLASPAIWGGTSLNGASLVSLRHLFYNGQAGSDAVTGTIALKFESSGISTTTTVSLPTAWTFSTVSNGAAAATDKMILTSSGTLGIGTTAPTQRLDISGTLGYPAKSGTTSTGYFRIRTNGGSNIADFGLDANNNLWVQSTDATDLSIKSPIALNPNGGPVLISTIAAPSAYSTMMLVVGDSSFTVATNGVVSVANYLLRPNQPGVRATGTTNSDLTGSGANTALVFGAEDYDTQGMHDVTASSDTFTAPVAGYYNIHCSAIFSDDITGNTLMFIHVNGSAKARSARTVSLATGVSLDVSARLILAASDAVKCVINNGNSTKVRQATFGDAQGTYFEMSLD